MTNPDLHLFHITHCTPVALEDDHPQAVPVDNWPDKFTQTSLIKLDAPRRFGRGRADADAECIRYRCYDDDDNLIIEGVMWADGSEWQSFQPLDFAGAMWGCTYMKVKTATGSWDHL